MEGGAVNIEKLTSAPWRAIDYLHEPESYSVDGVVVEKGWQILGADEPADEGYSVAWGLEVEGSVFPGRDDLEFIALARNAFEVMTRRGWHACPRRGNMRYWEVLNRFGGEGRITIPDEFRIAVDPFTALVDADKWYRENVERENPD